MSTSSIAPDCGNLEYKGKAVGLFAGVGGLELGFEKVGFRTELLSEIEPSAVEVLKARYPKIPIKGDVRLIKSLPKETALVLAGFPCQDLSQAGQTKGLKGEKSGLVMEVFRLLRSQDVPDVVLENVPFMLRHDRGMAMAIITGELEKLGYKWAYRVVDAQAFGIPQRRKRVYLWASKTRSVERHLFRSDEIPTMPSLSNDIAYGFYWTEGNTGLGWGVSVVPTLKSGSSLGIPSAPAIWLPDGTIGTPDIRDAERLQGFESDWTKPAENIAAPRVRWRLVGNAVSVSASSWLANLFVQREEPLNFPIREFLSKDAWPDAAFGEAGERFEVAVGSWPVAVRIQNLHEFLNFPLKPLSTRALTGFYTRLTSSRLKYSPEFKRALENALESTAC